MSKTGINQSSSRGGSPPAEGPHLRAVIYCPANLRTIRGYLGLPPEGPEHIPPTRANTHSFSRSEGRRKPGQYQVPALFSLPPTVRRDYGYGYFADQEQALGKSVQYLFSDDTLLFASEILYHPYRRAVPPSLLPLLGNVGKEIPRQYPFAFCGRADFRFSSEQYIEANRVLVAVLLESARSESCQVLLAYEANRERQRSVFRLNAVALAPEESGRWEVLPLATTSPANQGRAMFRWRMDGLSDNIHLFHHFAYDVDRLALLFHPFAPLLQNMEEHLREVGYPYRFAAGLPNSEQTLAGAATLAGHSIIESVVNGLLSDPGQKSPMVGFSVPIQVVPSQNLIATVSADADGYFRFSLMLRGMGAGGSDLETWNFPGLAEPLFAPLRKGFGAITTLRNGDIAGRNRNKREKDLYALKHVGYASCVLWEMTHFLLDGRFADGREAPNLGRVKKEIFSKLGLLLASHFDQTPVLTAPSLEKICSERVADLLVEWMAFLAGPARREAVRLFLPEGVFLIEGSFDCLLRFVRASLRASVEGTSGKCFQSLRVSAFANFFPNLAEAGPERSFAEIACCNRPSEPEISAHGALSEIQNYQLKGEPSALVATWLNLKNEGFTVLYQGNPLEELSEKDFKTEFILREAAGATNARNSIDWFELNPKFFFKGIEINSQQAQRLTGEGVIEFRGVLYLLKNRHIPSFKRLETFWQRIQNPGAKKIGSFGSETFLPLAKSQTLEMLALRASGVSVKGGKRWKKICNFYDSLGADRAIAPLPSSVHATLKPYQKQGVQWLQDLYRLGLGGILADDMGLGKTVETLAFLETLRVAGELGGALVIVPTSLTYNWALEAKRFTPEMPVSLFQSRNRSESSAFMEANPQAVLICTYGLFAEHLEWFKSRSWNIHVYDEAQHLKTLSTKRTTAARSVAAGFKLCLTGTPLENHLGELYSLMDLVVPGSLGDYADFKEKYVNPNGPPDKESIAYLRLQVKPLILRRTKAEILHELPAKTETSITIPFEKRQKQIYRDIAISWNDKVRKSIDQQGEARSQLVMLTALLRLRQACSDPATIPNIEYANQPPKVQLLIDSLAEISNSGESALVFTQFLGTLGRITSELERAGVPYFSFHGATSRVERQRILGAFNQSAAGSVLVTTLKTGGVGLNLTKASYVFHLEPWWNPAVENQASDRAHRIGQEKPVQVYRYLMEESVEEKIMALKRRKAAQFNAMFGDSEREEEVTEGGAGTHLLSRSDFAFLLGTSEVTAPGEA